MHRLVTAARALLAACIALGVPWAASAATLNVGPSGTYPKPCQAIASAAPGDVIEIDAAGTYSGDVCSIYTNNLTLRGVNGRPHIDAAGKNAGGKAIWVISGNDTVVENIEFSGATVPDRNGAAIRQEGANLTVRNCYIHDNEDGILSADSSSSTILIEHSEFAYNGYGDGQSHNLYINHVAKLIFRYNYSHHAKVGHLLKSRAAENDILYNRFSDEATGTASYEVDLPNGGTSYLIGNVIQQGPQSQNAILVAYREEGGTNLNPGTDLYVVNNTFVNDKASGTFINCSSTPTPAVIRNNVFSGPGSITTQSGAVLSANYSGNPGFVNAAAYDYHLQAGSPAIDFGTTPGSANGLSLVPVAQYVHPACYETRTPAGQFDAGAYEYGGGSGTPVCGGGSAPQPSPAALSALTLSPATLTGGASSSTNQVLLSAAAPSGGAVVTLSSSNSSVASVPASVTVPAGSTAASFPITTSSVTASTSVTISANYGGVSKSVTLIVNPAAQSASLAAVSLSSASITGGGTMASNQVVLSAAAPSGGAVVTLSSSNGSVASVPASVTVPAGSTAASFAITTGTVTTSTSVTISATYGGVSKSVTLTVNPAAQSVSLTAVSLSSASITGGGTMASNQVVLSAAAPSGGAVVSLSSSNSSVATVPASVTVPAGATSATFAVNTAAVAAPTQVAISAAYNGATRSATLTVNPPVSQTAVLQSLVLNPASVTAGTTTTANKVSLSSPAPAGGVLVSLTSSSSIASVPATVLVPAGATSATFSIQAGRVWWSTSVRITASAGGVSKSATLTVSRARY